jgi:serine/threonine protein kinase
LVLNEGDILGDYRVAARIGSGGMGTVYRAEHLITKRVEAMKALPLGIGSEPDAAERFEREIQAQARLQHPHIAALYTAVRGNNAIALIMEYVEGESLAHLLARGRLPVERAALYAGQILDALAHAHQHGVIHCDVTPANILITPAGDVKLTDFGLARAANDAGAVRDGVAAGSPWHMAPEQVRGLSALDRRTDVYGAATVVYEMLAGRKLFDAEGSFEILRAQLETVPRAPGAYNRHVPPALDRVVLKALAKDPAARFQDAAAFRRAIDAALSGAGRISPMVWGIAALCAIVSVGVAAFPQIEEPRRAPDVPTAHYEPAPAQPAPAPPAPPIASDPAPLAEPPRQPVRADGVELLPAPEPAKPEVDEAHLPSSVAAAAEAAPPLEQVKPEKSGNRFVRALGKLNPFRKGEKDK